MAQVTIKAVSKRLVTVDVKWDDGLVKNGIQIQGVPVEDFDRAQAFLASYIAGVYQTAREEADAIAYANPTPDPRVIGAIGKVFDNSGSVVS